MQKKGVGGALLYELTRAALLRGITKLRADVLHANTTMRRVLERVGAKPVTAESSDGLVAYELELAATTTSNDYQRAESEEDAAR